MRVLVTGAAGFIGQRLVERLANAGHGVVALARTPRGGITGRADVTVIAADINDEAALAKACAGCDAVVHLANATRVADPRLVHAVNVGGTEKLLAAARRAGLKRFVFISSISANRARLGPYGSTKRLAEERVRSAGLPFVILRPSLVYGPGGVGLVASLSAYLRGLPVVPVIGSGKIELDPVHMDDVCTVIEQCLRRDDVLGRDYDVLGPDRVTFNQFLERLADELGVHKPYVHIPGWFAMLMARFFGLISKSPPISVDNVLGTISPARVDRESAPRDFKIPWTPLDAGLRALVHPAPLSPEPFERAGRPLPEVPVLVPAAPLRPVRVGIVGLGKMGLVHGCVLSMIPDVELVGLSDLKPALAKNLWGVGIRAPFHGTLAALLEQARPDAVWVCTPPNSHWPITRACVEAGVAVFVEKPLAHDLEDARRLAELAARGGPAVACGYAQVYLPTFATAQAELARGVVGRPRRVRSAMYLSQVFGPQKGWIADASISGGGVVANLSSHLLFVLRWYFGLPKSARATWRKIHGPVEDEIQGVFTLDDGCEVSFESSWSVPDYPISDVFVTIEGERGTMRISNETLELELAEPQGSWPAGATRVRHSELAQGARFDFNGEFYYLEDAGFLAWVTGGSPPPISVAAAYDVQRMMSALYDSAGRDGAIVEVPR
jgi:predicted dehydrogenase/nucleoside-diphosphate-sugar epimerase